MPFDSKIASLMLYTPFDNKALVDAELEKLFDKETFIRECYVEPHFVQAIHLGGVDEENEFDYKRDNAQINSLYEKCKMDEMNFFYWIESDNEKIYTVSGNSGVGKSTYINKLKYTDNKHKWVILDVAKATHWIRWFGDIETVFKGQFNCPYCKMWSTVMAYLQTVLFAHVNEKNQYDIAKIYENLKTIVENYKQNVMQHYPAGRELFEQWDDIINGRETQEKMVYACATAIRDHINMFWENRNFEIAEVFIRTLDILLIVLFSQEGSFEKRHIVVFDNIERFLQSHEIFNAKLNEIRGNLATYSSIMNSVGAFSKGKIKFLIVLRNKSARMGQDLAQNADEQPSDLNIDSWFLMEDILKKKQEFYNKYKKQIVEPSLGVFMQILDDGRKCSDGELTGTKVFINSLFNRDKRLIAEFIGQIVETENNTGWLAEYKKLMEQNTRDSKFGARNIIYGLIYKTLAKGDNLFSHLKLLGKENAVGDGKDYGFSYARKILTILYNRANTYVPLSTVFAELCMLAPTSDIHAYWLNSLSEQTKNEIAEILYFMNSYNRRENDWIQFVDMQISGKTDNEYLKGVEKLKALIDSDLPNISLKIMPSGKAYLRYIVATFEFFSFRYGNSEGYKPLFLAVPTLEEIERCTDFMKLECMKIIKRVRTDAELCIRNIQNDIELVIQQQPRKIRLHKERIIDQHFGYIERFAKYVSWLYSKEEDGKTIIPEKVKQFYDQCMSMRIKKDFR